MKKFLVLLTMAFIAVAAIACDQTTTAPVTTAPVTTAPVTTQPPVTTTTSAIAPVISGAGNVELGIGAELNLLEGVSATDAEDGDLTDEIVVTGTVNNAVLGANTITYTVTDSNGHVTTVTRTVTVVDWSYPTGFYNFKFADTELRHTFMAAAEKYLMNNLYGGIPMFANGSFVLYSTRLQLPVEQYIAVMGYGTAFATMSEDDSTVIMDDGELGNAGEYTYRTYITENPTTLQQWIYDDSVSSTVISTFLDSLYTYHFNAAKTGYEVVPSMASANPIPVESHITETGKEVATTWRIPLKDNLEWSFNDDTDVTGITDFVIDANDFVDTFKLALDEGWFRAISGGGDFLADSQAILNAQEYIDGTATWEEVGIKVVDDLTIEFTFVNDMSGWNVRYWLSDFTMGPIQLELYEELMNTETGVSSYGTTAETTAYNGPYILDYYEQDKVLRFVENPNYHSPDEYFYTAWTMEVIKDSAIAFQAFVDGRLEAVNLPTEYYQTYKNYPTIRQVPGATTFRLMINGLGTAENQVAQFPDSTYVPEPILANLNFKKAMFFAIDREYLAETVLKTSTTNMYLFSPAYLVDAELGIPYRLTEQGLSVGEGLSPSTYGYNLDAAIAYWQLAVQEEIAAGHYVAGTAATPTKITLNLYIFSGSVAQQSFGRYVETVFESTFIDYLNNIVVDVVVEAKAFPGIYYNYMMTGDFDLSIGGISGSTLDAASFLEVFCSDNRGGFTLNWGIDTTVAEIPVVYTTFDGETHYEIWSFDAITHALNAEVYLQDGEEAEVPAATDIEIGPDYVSFTIKEFSNDAYENITYTIQEYIMDTDEYVDVVGLVNIVAASADITVEGLTSYYYDYDADGNVVYQGDYQIVINYTYAEDPEKTGSSVSPWFNTLPVIAASTPTVLETSATIDLDLQAGYDGTITGAVLLVSDTWEAVAGGAVNYANIDAIAVTGLAAATEYAVILTFSDGNIDVFYFTTAAAPAA